MKKLLSIHTAGSEEYTVLTEKVEVVITDELKTQIKKMQEAVKSFGLYTATIFNYSPKLVITEDDDEDMLDRIDVSKLIVAEDNFRWEGSTKYNNASWYTDSILIDF